MLSNLIIYPSKTSVFDPNYLHEQYAEVDIPNPLEGEAIRIIEPIDFNDPLNSTNDVRY